MSTYTIGKRLNLAFGGLSVAVVVLGLTSLKMTEGVGSQLELAINQLAREQVLAGRLSTAVADMSSDERGVAFSTVLQQSDRSGQFKEQFAGAAGRAKQALKELRPLAIDSRLSGTVEDLDRQLAALSANHVEMADLLASSQMDAALKYFDETMLPRLATVGDSSKRLAEEASRQLSEMEAGARQGRVRNRWLTLLLLGISVLASVGVVVEVRRSTRSLRRLTNRMQSAATEVGEASQQISAASETLAQGASQQAGSLEETSSSSQEMSSMTQRNAENARQVTRLMAEVDRRVGDANRSLGQMSESIEEISGSSEKIARIIKVIDEISFQTNILALNAAVEAARAGEAGMGFAVVADEVRNLAQRCAQAARDTAGLIEESIQTAGDGAQKLKLMTEAIRSITSSAAEVKRLADEVNLGSDEQARGIEHVAQALAQMEQVTQQVATGAAHSASAASTMTAQSRAMDQVVAELVALAGRD